MLLLQCTSDRTSVAVQLLLLSCEAHRGGVIQPEFADALCASMPHMTNVVIANAAHEIHHDQPDEFMQAVLHFLKKASL